MDIYVLDNELTRVRTVATSSECLSATEELELGKAGQLTLSLPISYKDTVKEMNILAIHDRDDRYRLYIVTNRNLNNYTLDIVAISYPNYALSRVGNVKDLRPKNRPLTELIPQILGNSGWTLNHVDENLPGYTGSFYYLSRLECLSQVSEALACEFDFYVTITKNVITGQFVDVVEMLGEDTNRRFEYGTNALEVVAEYDATEVYTQAVGRGKGEETGDGYGRRIEFTDVVWSKANGDPVDKPKGQNWVNDPYENYQLPGNKRPQKIIEFEEITDPNVLLEETYKWLLDNNHPKVQFKAKIVETGALNLGDRVQIIRPDLDIRYKTRVFKLTRNLLNENLTEVEFGDNIATTPMDKLNSITTQVNSTNQALQRVEEQITMIDADGNRITYGPDEPPVKKKGDMWYKTTPDGKTELYIWNGETWELTIGDAIFDDLEKKVNDAMSDAEQAKVDANIARDNALNAINKATQVEQDFNTEIEDVQDSIVSIKEIQGGLQSQVSSNTGNISSLTQTTNGLKSQVSNIYRNGVNMFPDGNFQDGELDKYFYAVPDMSYISRVTKDDVGGDSFDWSLKFKSRTNGKVFLLTQTYVACKAGNTLSINFEYFNKDNASDIFFSAKFEKVDGDFYEPISLTIPKEQSTSWKRYANEIKIPDDATSVQFSIGTLKSDVEGALCYIANVLVNSVEVTGTQFTQTIEGIKSRVSNNEGNISTLTQTANTILTDVKNLENKTDTKFLQTDRLIALQANKIGVFYPDGNMQCGDVNMYYFGYPLGGTVQNASLNKLNDIYRLWIRGTGVPVGKYYGVKLKDSIKVDASKKLLFNFNYRLYWTSSATEGEAEVIIREYAEIDGVMTSTNDISISVKADEKLKWYTSSNTIDLQYDTELIDVIFRNKNLVGDKFESSYTSVYLSNGTDNLSSMVSVANDNINLSVQKGDVINQINVSSEGILIDGNKIHITGATSIDNAAIKDAAIANLSASKLTAGTIDANKIRVINMDVNSLTGNKAQFLQAAFKAANSTSYIDGYGIRTKKDGGNSTALNTGRLEMRDKGDNLVYSLGGADWLDPNGYDDTALMKILGRRQFTIGFATDEDEYTVTPMVSFKERDDRNMMFIERDSFRIVSWDGYRLRPGSSYNSENGQIYPSLTNDNESVGILLGDKDLILRDGYADDAGSKQMTLNRIRSGQLDSLKTPEGKFTLTIRDGSINGNDAFVFSGQKAKPAVNWIAMNNSDIKLKANYNVIFGDRYGRDMTLDEIRRGKLDRLTTPSSTAYPLAITDVKINNNPGLALSGTNKDNYIALNNADIWIKAKYNIVFSDGNGNGITLDSLRAGRTGQLQTTSKKYKIAITDSEIYGSPALALSGTEKDNFIAINNTDIYIKAQTNLVFDDGYGSGITLNQLRSKLEKSASTLISDNGEIHLDSARVKGKQVKILADDEGACIAFADGTLMFRDLETDDWHTLSELLNNKRSIII